jgi:photosystem II stability/assembly factor-like uncharacterized protein
MRFISIITLYSLFFNATCFSQYWLEQNSGVTVPLNSVSGISGYMWVCGDNSTVLKTTNAGINWIAAGNGIPTGVTLVTIWGENNMIAVTAGYNSSGGVAYRTSNGGLNWTLVFSQTGGSINAVYVSTGVRSFMVGNPVGGRWSLWKSTNDGVSWDSIGLYIPQTNSETGFPNSLFVYSNDVWFGSSNSRLYHSSNNGVSWSFQSISPEASGRAVWFLSSSSDDPVLSFGLCGGASLMKTTNSGSSWFQVTTPGSGNIMGITGGIVDGASWLIKGNTIYSSVSQGSYWTTDYVAAAGTFNHISLVRDIPTRIWAVRSNGGISRYTSMSVIIEGNSGETPDNYALYQNYPNPFNPSTKFKIQIAKLSDVKVTIFDILGREAATLVNEPLKPGSYEVEWDGSNFSSGIYFYRLEAGTFSETKKMVILK